MDSHRPKASKKTRGEMEKKEDEAVLGSYGYVLVIARKGLISAVARRDMARTLRLLYMSSCQSRGHRRDGTVPSSQADGEVSGPGSAEFSMVSALM